MLCARWQLKAADKGCISSPHELWVRFQLLVFCSGVHKSYPPAQASVAGWGMSLGQLGIHQFWTEFNRVAQKCKIVPLLTMKQLLSEFFGPCSDGSEHMKTSGGLRDISYSVCGGVPLPSRWWLGDQSPDLSICISAINHASHPTQIPLLTLWI